MAFMPKYSATAPALTSQPADREKSKGEEGGLQIFGRAGAGLQGLDCVVRDIHV